MTFVYGGETYNCPLKMESATKVSFTAAGTVTITIHTDTASKNIKVDGTRYTTDANGEVTLTLEAGSHTITKGDSLNLCYIILE